MTEISQTDVAYIAGLIDGEGSIVMKIRPDGRQMLVLQIANNDRKCLEFAQSIFLGNQPISGTKYHYKDRPRNNISYRLIWAGFNAKPVLQAILPYLIIKRRQAELAIKFQDIVDSHSPKTSPLLDWEMVLRDCYASAIKELNHTGDTIGGKV